MKKWIALVLLLCLGLAACGSKDTLTHTHEDITIRIPADFIDLSEDAFASGLSFVYGRDPIAVNGLREPKATFTSLGLQLDLSMYADFMMKANNVTTELETRDGILTFSYTSGDYAYMVTIRETEEAFWTIQAYCPTEKFANVKYDMWEILSSVKV